MGSKVLPITHTQIPMGIWVFGAGMPSVPIPALFSRLGHTKIYKIANLSQYNTIIYTRSGHLIDLGSYLTIALVKFREISLYTN